MKQVLVILLLLEYSYFRRLGYILVQGAKLQRPLISLKKTRVYIVAAWQLRDRF